MKNNRFQLLRGGLLDSAQTSRKIFVSAYVTNTRLMGVLGMYIHFKLPDNQLLSDFHQFFYFDAEEYGFETYKSILGNDETRLCEIENALIGGLGGEKISITLREARFLLQEYVRLNRRSHLPLPDGYEEYKFLLEQDIFLPDPELYVLMYKQCITPKNHYELINYFLMRIIGRDFGAASFLTNQRFPLDLFPEFTAGTFCKNTIDKGDLPDTFVCESLVEFEDNYYIAISMVTLQGMTISEFERISLFKISSAEAALMLSRSEFVTVYQMAQPSFFFTGTSTSLVQTAMATPHDNGILYMMFHPNNKHVAKQEYRLNEDILGMYYISDSGQLIAAAYSAEEIQALEHDLYHSPMKEVLTPSGRYEFQEPVLYEFIQSGFMNFHDFVDAIKTGEE